MIVQDNEKRIAKNTVFLYVRILLSVALSLYTSRVVLEALGVADYGVYNVVGGLIVILSFLNGTMSGATQRFLNFEMGRGQEGRLAETFSAAWVIHLSIAGIVILLGETIGLWIVNHFLEIAPERMVAANWTYQFSLFGGVFAVLMVPFTGAVFAHEKMNVYAIITLAFSVMKLGVVLLILYSARADNLITYAGLMLGVSFLHFLFYVIYCLSKFSECRLSVAAEKNTVTTILKFSGSDLIGTSCYTIENQGVLVILNKIGGTVLNAAGGLATTVTLTINQFGTSLIMAFRPQIIKQYAAHNYEMMQRLMVNCAKYSIILLSLIAVPVYVEMEFVLNVWLTDVPDHTLAFCRIAMLASMSQMTISTLNCGIHATGKIFSFSVITGLTYLIELPIMYALIVLTGSPSWVYILPVFQLTFNIGLISVMLRKRMREFKIAGFITRGFLAPTLVTLVCAAISFIPEFYMSAGWGRFIVVALTSTALLGALSWSTLFDSEMRSEIIAYIKSKH